MSRLDRRLDRIERRDPIQDCPASGNIAGDRLIDQGAGDRLRIAGKQVLDRLGRGIPLADRAAGATRTALPESTFSVAAASGRGFYSLFYRHGLILPCL